MPTLWIGLTNTVPTKVSMRPAPFPGNAFEGGGEGICRREANEVLGKVDLTCVQRSEITIIRDFYPDTEFLASPGFCRMQNDKQVADKIAHSEVTCVKPEIQAQDRFCRDKEAGDSCAAEIAVDGAGARFPGQCRQHTEKMRFYLYGYNDAEREVLTCDPLRVAPKHEYKPVGFFQGLFK